MDAKIEELKKTILLENQIKKKTQLNRFLLKNVIVLFCLNVI